ncbi:MAG: hypothetical protein ACHQT7_01830 [Candidatus Levyibacteriota bacterium]
MDESLPEYRETGTVRQVEINGMGIERSYMKREDWGEPVAVYDFQLRQKHAFKILVCLEGEAVLEIPESVEPMGMVYGAGEARSYVRFLPGTIAVMEGPTAWLFRSSKGGFEYLYISTPRWSEKIDVKAINSREK